MGLLTVLFEPFLFIIHINDLSFISRDRVLIFMLIIRHCDAIIKCVDNIDTALQNSVDAVTA